MMLAAARPIPLLAFVAACQFQHGQAPIDATAEAGDASADAAVDTGLVDACSGCPANDVPGGAEQITGTTVLMPMLANAHDDVSTSCGGAGGRDLFYELVVPAQQVVYIDTETSTADAVIALRAGPCTITAQELACSNDPCTGQTFAQVARTLAPGTYCMVVDEATATGNQLVIDVFYAGRDGTQLTGTPPYVVSGDTCAGADVTDPSCEMQANNPGTAKDDMFWYTRCGGTHTVTASTCDAVGYDSIVYVTGRSGAGHCVDDGCASGNGSNTTGAFSAGAGFLQVTVDGWNGACGTYTLTVSF